MSYIYTVKSVMA